MAEETGSATPASGGEGVSTSPASISSEGASGQLASAAAGNAPGGGGDAGSAGEATGTPAGTSAAQFAFLKRQFRDQKHAEEVFGSEIGMTRGLQRQNADLEKRAATLEAELNALRPLVVERAPQARGQGVREGAQAPGESKSFAKELADSGELNLIAKIFADPEMGPAHAMYRMAELLETHTAKQFEGLREHFTGEIRTRDGQNQLNTTAARTFTIAKNLSSEYPELDSENQSDEAIEAQQSILKSITDLPGGPQWLATDAAECLRWAAEKYRRTHGTPIFAQPPGTSGSPSSRAAAAAEAASSATALDGSGVPRQRSSGQPESDVERVKRENRENNKRIVTTPSGRPLGFEMGA